MKRGGAIPMHASIRHNSRLPTSLTNEEINPPREEERPEEEPSWRLRVTPNYLHLCSELTVSTHVNPMLSLPTNKRTCTREGKRIRARTHTRAGARTRTMHASTNLQRNKMRPIHFQNSNIPKQHLHCKTAFQWADKSNKLTFKRLWVLTPIF